MFIIIPIPILPLPIPRLINLRIRNLPIKLHILSLPLSHHDRILQMHMNNRHQLTLIRLKKHMSNIIKQQIDTRVGTNGSLVAKTVFVDFEFARDTFVVGVGTGIDVDETLGTTVADFAKIFLFDDVFHFFFFGFSFYDVLFEFLDVAEDVGHALGVGAAEG
jgi:hypothetical protein